MISWRKDIGLKYLLIDILLDGIDKSDWQEVFFVYIN